MSRYPFDDAHGERWWVGYDAAAATFFLDRDRDLDDNHYAPAPMRTVREVLERADQHVAIPAVLLERLAHDEPVRTLAAEASSIARMDQAQAAASSALRASYPHAPTAAAGSSTSPQARRRTPPTPGRAAGHEVGD